MKDKGLDIFLAVLFGIGGIVILVLAWAGQMPVGERIFATLIASIGLIWVLTRMPSLMSTQRKVSLGKHLPEVEFHKKPH